MTHGFGIFCLQTKRRQTVWTVGYIESLMVEDKRTSGEFFIFSCWGTLGLYEKPDQDWLREKNSLYLHPNPLQTLRPKNKQKIRSVQMCKDMSTPTCAAKYFTVVFLVPCWHWLKRDFAVLILMLEKRHITHDESWECHVNRRNKHTAVALSRWLT